jgi:death on curing protein
LANEPEWLSADQLKELNRYIVEGTREPYGVLKPHELQSVPARPRQLFHYDNVQDVAALATRLMMSVVWAHPFAQGNKRTGFAAAVIFCEANGWLLDIPDFEDIAELIIDAADSPELEPEIAELFRRNLIQTA